MKYNDSKSVGDIIESEILNRIKSKYSNAYIDNTGKANSDWDVFIPEINEGVEIKSDYKSRFTGNLVIEVEMNGKLSGLSVTKAKYWIFVNGIYYIWIKPIEIYRFLEQNFCYGRVPFIGKGDTVTKIAHLISINRFIEYVSKLDKKDGYVEEIKTNDPLHFTNFSKVPDNVIY